MRSFYQQIDEALYKKEKITGIVFGSWRDWDFLSGEKEDTKEEEVPLVPEDKRGVVLTLEEAKPYLEGWDICSEDCIFAYVIFVWTTLRVFFVVDRDGAWELNSVPAIPVNTMPYLI
jgi:hypothetical protein